MDLEELAMLLQTMDGAPVSADQFTQASLAVRSGALKLEQDQQLMLYALFKQASEGDAPAEQPASADPTAPYKYQAWKTVAGFPQDGAARVYVYLVNELVTAASSADGKGNEKDSAAQGFGCVFSTLMSAGTHAPSANWSDTERLFSLIEAGDEEALLSHLKDHSADVDVVNQEGLTALHFAADRGSASFCQHLLGAGAAVDARDRHGQTALFYAAVCDHVDVGEVLLRARADSAAVNSDGESLRDMDLSATFLALLAAH